MKFLPTPRIVLILAIMSAAVGNYVFGQMNQQGINGTGTPQSSSSLSPSTTTSTNQAPSVSGTTDTRSAAEKSERFTDSTDNTPTYENTSGPTPEELSSGLKASSQGVTENSAQTASYISGTLKKYKGVSVGTDEIVRMALANNLDIKINELNPEIEDLRITQAWGAFDPNAVVNGSWEDIRRPQNTQEFISTGGTAAEVTALNKSPRIFWERNWRTKVGIEGKTPLGTTYEIKSETSILRNPLNKQSVFSLFSPEYSTFNGIVITQPLLRDFGPNANLVEVRVARQNKQIAEQTLRASLIKNVAEVLKTYYDLTFAIEDMKVKEKSVDLASKLLEENRNQLETGMRTMLDLTSAEVAVSEGLEKLLIAHNTVMERQVALKRLVLQEADQMEDEIFSPSVDVAVISPVKDRATLLAQAFEKRPEYLQSVHEAQREEIRLRFARNQLYPRLDIKSTLGYNGLAATYDRAMDDAFEEQAPQYAIGFEVKVPLGNIEGTARLSSAKKIKEQSILKVKQSELNLVMDINAALTAVDMNRQRVRTVSKTRELAQENLKAEEERLEKGLTTSLNVLKFQRDLAEARTREIAASVDLNKSLVQLHQADGTLLDELKIVVRE